MKNYKDIKKIAVLGAGTMGPGIAQIYATGGFDVIVWTLRKEEVIKAKNTIRNQLITFAEEGEILKNEIDQICERITFVKDLNEAVREADFIQETIIEDKEIKKHFYKQLNEMVRKDTIIASNTSALDIFALVPESLSSQVIICHWYSPPHLIPLVEVVGNEESSENLTEIASNLLRHCKKEPVIMKKFIPGYIVNRLQFCLNREIFNLLDNDICDPEAIDTAVKASFIPRACVLGLCKKMDFGGLDVTANNYKSKSYSMPINGDEMPITLARHIEAGELGVKTGKGFYDYSGENIEKLQSKRDKQLFEVLRLQKQLLKDSV